MAPDPAQLSLDDEDRRQRMIVATNANIRRTKRLVADLRRLLPEFEAEAAKHQGRQSSLTALKAEEVRAMSERIDFLEGQLVEMAAWLRELEGPSHG